MASRPRIQWQELTGTDSSAWWTPGWLPDTDVLRASLANALRVEGGATTLGNAYTMVDASTIREGWVAEDEFGDWVEVSPYGVNEHDGTTYARFAQATIALLAAVQD